MTPLLFGSYKYMNILTLRSLASDMSITEKFLNLKSIVKRHKE